MNKKLVLYLISLGVMALNAGSLFEAHAQHPEVKTGQDGKTADAGSCQSCHAAKSAGLMVHAAVQAGCDTCHEITRFGKQIDITLKAEGNDLCYACHEDKRPQQGQLSLHTPLHKELCTTCHEPHSSPNAKLLRQPIDNIEAARNLCLSCHRNIAAQTQKRVKHPALEAGCGTCHTTHKSEPSGKPEGVFHLTASQPDLCLACHDATDAAIQKAHRGQPFARSRCSECHNPHGSDRPKLINNFMHAAFEGDSCSTCHSEPKPGQGTAELVEGARRKLCLECHADVQETLTQAKVKHPALDTDSGCVACHSPHAATYPHQLRRGPVKTCMSCHKDVAEVVTVKKYLHRPVTEIGCATCHQPHGGERKRFLRAETNDLCLACHDIRGMESVQLHERTKEPLPLFGGAVSIDPGFLKSIKTIQLDLAREKGHPILSRHPVRGDHPQVKNLTCLTCHQPHAANGSGRLFVKDIADGQELCRMCH